MKMRIALATVALSGCVMLNAVAQTAGTTGQEKPQVATQQAKDTYVCPMHADATADKAGKCPKCGMALEKRAASTDARHAKKHADAKASVGKSKEECMKSCEGKTKEECAKNCAKESEAGCAGKH